METSPAVSAMGEIDSYFSRGRPQSEWHTMRHCLQVADLPDADEIKLQFV